MYCQIRQYRLANWPIPVDDFVNTGWRIGQYRLANWPIPVGDFANTGEGTFSKIWAGSRSKSKILKTWRVLELCLDMESSLKKKSIFLFQCPFNKARHYWLISQCRQACCFIISYDAHSMEYGNRFHIMAGFAYIWFARLNAGIIHFYLTNEWAPNLPPLSIGSSKMRSGG